MTPAERLRQLHADAPGGPWFPIVNDLIGEWSVANRNAPMSEIDTRPGSGDYVAADFVTEQQARLIATLRNALPQLANLAEAAANALLIHETTDGYWVTDTHGTHIDGCRSCLLLNALADLEAALQ